MMEGDEGTKTHVKLGQSSYEVNPEEATTYLEYVCNLSTASIAKHNRQAKILCTLGKNSREVEAIEKMIEGGMNIARVVLGQGTQEYHSETVQNIRTAISNHNKKVGRPYPVAIAVDLKGAEIHTGYIEETTDVIELKAGNLVKLTTDRIYSKACNDEFIYVDYENITKVVREGCKVYLNQGYIELCVKKVHAHILDCEIVTGGKLKSYFQINLPNVKVDLPPLTEQDKQDILFACTEDIDIIVVSFVRNSKGIAEAKKIISDENKEILVLAKIENYEGLDNLAEIIDVSDGLVVGRGDLGIELSIEKIFLAQKYLISIANLKNKPVFLVSQLMESMITNSRPTRSEVADVANAVLDGVDVLVLAKETAKGQYIQECVNTLAEICKEAEACIWRKQTFKDLCDKTIPPVEAQTAVAIGAVHAAMKIEASAIMIVTQRGKSAQIIAKFRPRCPILAITRSQKTANRLCCYKGIIPYLLEKSDEQDWMKDMDNRVQTVMTIAKHEKIIKIGDGIVVVTGWKHGLAFTNTIRVFYVPAVNQTVLY